jgi:hypothetical protein
MSKPWRTNKDSVEIGPDVWLTPLHRHGEKYESIVAYIVSHKGADGWCEGSIAVEPGYGPPVWTQMGSLAGGDLSLEPSVQCKTHPDFHAHVENGRWTG